MAETSAAPRIPAAQETPGAFRAYTTPTLHTRFAQALYVGRPFQEGGPPPIVGLEGFGRLVARIWRSAQYDDLYADFALLRIEEFFAATQRLIRTRGAAITRILGGMDEIDIGLGASLDPVRVRLEFSHPYGHQGGFLLKDYDDLMRALLTARAVGVMDRDKAWIGLLEARKAMRRYFSLPALLWRYTGVTRRDVGENTVLAQQAAAFYAANLRLVGPLPPEVVAGTRRGKFAPPIRQAQARPRFLEEEDEKETGDEREAP